MSAKKTRDLFLTAALVFFASAAGANSLPFDRGLSVRAAGSSSSLSPFIAGAQSSYINPALLAYAAKQEINCVYFNLFESSLVSSLSYALPLLDLGSFGFSFIYMSSPEMAGLDANNTVTDVSYSESYIQLGASYGIRVMSIFSAGLSLKYINHSLTPDNYPAVGMDAGLAADLPLNSRISLAVFNVVKPEFKYASGFSDILPISADLTLSGKYRISRELSDSLSAGAGLIKSEDSPSYGWNAGIEYSVFDSLAAARLGISDSGFSLGGSVSYAGASIDYAYVKTALDFMHRFSISYSFGRDIRQLEEELRTKEDKLKYELVQKIRQDALIELKEQITSASVKGDLESAREALQKALV